MPIATLLLLVALFSLQAAQATISSWTAGSASVSADTANTGAWTTVSTITINEGNEQDVSGSGGNTTIVLAAPSGFEWETGSGTPPRITISNCANDGNSPRSNPTASLTNNSSGNITFTVVPGNNRRCRFTIDRIRVRVLSGSGSGTGTFTVSNTGTAPLLGISAPLITLTKVAGTATKLNFGTQPVNATAGSPMSANPTVRVEDAFGNLVTSSSAAIVLGFGNNPGGSTINGATTQNANASGGIATFSNLTLNKTGTGYTFSATSGSLQAATSVAFNVSAGTASKLTFSQQPTNTQATAIISPNITVRVEDTNGNLVTGSTASVTLAFGSNPGAGTLSGNVTRQASGGIATFNDISINKAANAYMLVATSGSLTQANSNNFNITAGPATQLVYTQQPTSTTAGSNISPGVTVQLQDAGGNVVTTTGTSITISIGANPGGGTLSGSLNATTTNGVASFSNLSINKAGVGYTLSATSGSLPAATSATFNINAGTAAKLAFITQPSDTNTNTVISPSVTVQIQDANGNATTSAANVTVAIGTNPAGGTLTGTLTVPASSGLATFSTLKINNAGVGYTLTATSGSLTSTTSNAFNITGGVPTKLAFTTQPSNSTPGNVITPPIVVQVQDVNGAQVTSSSAAVTLAIQTNPGNSNITGTVTRNAVNGVATFDDIALTNLGSGYSLVATATALTQAISESFNITNEICFVDAFSSTASLSNWAVGNESGGVNPTVTGGRLRLTTSANQVSTYATLQRLFPAAGNKVSVTFRYYSYNGSGADGIAVTLSDASVAPVAGAFGGSLGYAPKLISAGGEVNHPGFAGGWIGIALDEFGNYSANTEGRSGGSAPGVRTDSVAVRGSGSGYSGYAYLTGTSTLSPGVDLPGSTPGPGHLYRIIVDHTNGVNAYTSVERDTTGSGNNFTFLINPFDAKGYATQAAVPTNWFLSLTGSTGGSTNIHEIDDLEVCSPVQQTLTLHHVRLEYNTSALMCGGGSATAAITVKACGNAACTTLYPGSVTVSLSATSGTLSTNNVTFTGGSTTVNLTSSVTGSVNLAGSVSSPSISTATCYTGSTEQACANTAARITFTSTPACFNVTETNNAPGSRLLTKLVNTAFNLDVIALGSSGIDTGSTKQFQYSLVNPNAASGNCSDTNTGLTAWSATQQFQASEQGRKSVPFIYANAAQNIKVRIRDMSNNAVTCSSDDFSIRPFALSVTTSPTNATTAITGEAPDPLFRAGDDPFTVATRPVNATNATVTGYNGYPKVDTSLLKVAMNTAGVPGSVMVGTLATSPTVTVPPTFQSSTLGTFTYNGVGTLYFDNLTLYDDLWVDHDITNGDCIRNAANNTVTSGMYGCNIANVNTNFGSSSNDTLHNSFVAGRFIPSYFGTQLVGTMGCGSITFATPCPGPTSSTTNMVYSGQPFKAIITAYLKGGAIATGYDGIYLGARTTTLALCDTVGCADPSALTWGGTLAIKDAVSGASQGLTLAPTRFSAGTATIDFPSDPATNGERAMTFTFTNAASVPINIYLRASDTNNVTSKNDTAANSIEGGLKVISGRARILNATGSEYADTPVPARVEFWQANNQGWIINPMDTITNATLSTSVVNGLAGGVRIYDIGNKTGLGTGAIATPANLDRLYREAADTGFNGNFNLWVKAPGVPGTVDITLGVKPWLQFKWDGTTPSDPIGRVGLGMVKRSRIIYRQEMVR